MRSSLTSSVFLLVLWCCVGFSEAICVECLEIDGHLGWCRWFNGPITGTETEGHLGSQLNPPMTWQINSSVFSTFSSETLQDTVITCATSSLATPQTSELSTCRVCGKRFKNSLRVRIHMARMHKDKAALPPPSTDTNINTQNVAVEGLLTTTTTTTVSAQTSSSALMNNKAPTEGRETTSTFTSTRTSTISNPTNRVSAAGSMSTPSLHELQQSPRSLRLVQAQQSSSLPDNTPPSIHSTTTRQSVMRVVKNRPTLVASRPIERLKWKCICSKLLNGYRGYKSHIRSCVVAKRLLVSPGAARAGSDSHTVSQSAGQEHEAIDVDNYRSADIHSLPSDLDFDLNSNKLNSSANLITNNVTDTNDNIPFIPTVPNVSPDSDLGDDRGSLSQDKTGIRIAFDHPSPSASKPWRPLPGVPLPRTEAAWLEMNRFFHAAPIFRFATGVIGDIDLAAAEFNQAIYGYLKDKYGTLRGNKILSRPITLQSVPYKIFSSFIRNRLQAFLDK